MTTAVQTTRPTTVYNLEKTLQVIGNKPATTQSMRRVIREFLSTCQKLLELEENQELHFYVSPREIQHGKTIEPFRYISPQSDYRKYVTDCVLWISTDGIVGRHFPYVIHTDDTILSFDAGPTEMPGNAAQIVHDVIRKDDHTEIMSMSTEMNLVELYVKDLLPFAAASRL
jgi:hypothetical protein